MPNKIVFFIAGAVCLLGGLVALFNPLAASFTAEQIAGWLFIFAGAIQVFASFQERWSVRAWLTGLLGALGILVGVSVVARPLEGIIALTWLVAIFFVVSGAAKVMLSWPLRGTQFFWILLGSGALSAILGILILAGLPASAGIVLGTMLAIDLISSGVALIGLALAKRPGTRCRRGKMRFGGSLSGIAFGIVQGLRTPSVQVLLALTLALIGCATIAYRLLEGWRWIDALYFSVVTIATVGYGDLAPKTDGGKLFTVCYIMMGIGLFVSFASALSRQIIENAGKQ